MNNNNNNKPTALPIRGNLYENWKRYKSSFKHYLKNFKIAETDNSEACHLFFKTIGQYGYEIADELKLLNASKDNISSNISLQDLYEHFDRYCQFNSELNLCRFRFFAAKQGTDKFKTPDAKDPAEIEVKSKYVKNNEHNIANISNRKRNSTAKPEVDLEIAIPECSTSKIQRKMAFVAENRAASETIKGKGDNNGEHKLKKRHNSTEKIEADSKKVLQEKHPTETRKLQRETSYSKDYDTFEAKRKYIKIQGGNDRERGESFEATRFKSGFKCKFCEFDHKYGECPMFRVNCQLCGIRGHSAKKCTTFGTIEQYDIDDIMFSGSDHSFINE